MHRHYRYSHRPMPPFMPFFGIIFLVILFSSGFGWALFAFFVLPMLFFKGRGFCGMMRHGEDYPNEKRKRKNDEIYPEKRKNDEDDEIFYV